MTSTRLGRSLSRRWLAVWVGALTVTLVTASGQGAIA
ncbi:MAG: hypothetical protein QOJ10_1876, partial [Chloroflexota bacterium]|nr:hypothetical protein [Chloroflexota bacterium]